MRLRDMNTVQLAAALCLLAGPLERIGGDAAITELFKNINQQKGEISRLQATAMFAGKLIPVLLDRHQEDTITALSVLTGKSVEKIKTQKGAQTIKDLRSVLDKDLLDFFLLSA